MPGWPDGRFLALTGAALPIVQAPMAGAGGPALAVAAIAGGALGSLPCALLSAEQIVEQAGQVRAGAEGPLNLNFFCHRLGDPPDDEAWRKLLGPFYDEEGVAPGAAPPLRRPFDVAMAEAVEGVKPEVVSFHFGLPDTELLGRVRRTGAKILGNATTPAEGRWLAERGCDAVIAQGFEAGGHAGWFLGEYRPVGLLALVRQLSIELPVPVIAAGGIVDARSIAAAMLVGASAVQIGTAYLATPESMAASPHRALLGTRAAEDTAFTNLLSGRAARGIRNRLMDLLGPIRSEAPAFPFASNALAPLRRAAEADGRGDFSPLWAGQAAALVRAMPAQTLTETLGREARALLEGVTL